MPTASATDQIMDFIRAHPLSSNIEIAKGTGVYPALVSSVTRRKFNAGRLVRQAGRPYRYAVSKLDTALRNPREEPAMTAEEAFKAGWRYGFSDGGDSDCGMFEPTAERAWDTFLFRLTKAKQKASKS